MKTSNYDDSDLNSILNYAQKLVGKTVREILKISEYRNEIKNKDKGGVGKIVEQYWFDIKANNSPEPDFEKVGVELKVVPLIQKKNKLLVKERTKVCSIDYKKLLDETWTTSHAKNKLDKVLFVYYIYDKEDIQNSIINRIDLWELSHDSSKLIIKNDWLNTQKSIRNGYAHTLSESQSKILAPSRSGSGGKNKDGNLRDLVLQPNILHTQKALKRAFSLKQSFTNQRFQELATETPYESIIDSLKIDNFDNFETIILNSINKYTNKSIQEISNTFKLNVSSKSKNMVATIIKKMIGFKSVKSNIKEFEQLGIIVKTIKARKRDNQPLEAISFTTMKLKEFIGETWEVSTFKEYINKILFIPVYHDSTSLDEKYLGKAFFWSPSNEEEQVISTEWENYRLEVINGSCKTEKIYNKSKKGYKNVSSLSKESDTHIIHMRPHGRDSNDIDSDMFDNDIVKQCFWLNRKFIKKLIDSSLGIKEK
ncbi:MAG: Sau3AI family type II restriction endonuclease [Sulfurimonas sp.]|nr:Sau3AI family type II restriction endonuclease [Sulfurimonas sp.]